MHDPDLCGRANTAVDLVEQWMIAHAIENGENSGAVNVLEKFAVLLLVARDSLRCYCAESDVLPLEMAPQAVGNMSRS